MESGRRTSRKLNGLGYVAPLLIVLLAWFGYYRMYSPLEFSSFTSDPESAYLVNGLLLTQGVGVYHSDHPGSVVQWGIAVAMWLTGNGGTDWVSPAVLETIRSLFAFGTVIALTVWVGIVSFKAGGALAAVLLLIAWSDPNIWLFMGSATPEGFILALYLPAITLVALYREVICRRLLAVLAVAVLLGVLTTAKLTLWPTTLLVLWIVCRPNPGGDRRKWAEFFSAPVVSIGAYLAVMTLTIEDNARAWQWLGKLIANSGRYGAPDATNNSSWLPVPEIFEHFLYGISLQAPVLPLVWFCLIALAVSVILKESGAERWDAVVFLGSIVLSALIYSKHPFQIKYLIPVLMSGCVWVCVAHPFLQRLPRMLQVALGGVLAVAALNAWATFHQIHGYYRFRDGAVAAMVDTVTETAPHLPRYFAYGIPHEAAALAFAVNHAPSLRDRLFETYGLVYSVSERQSLEGYRLSDRFPVSNGVEEALIFIQYFHEHPRAILLAADPDRMFFAYYLKPAEVLPAPEQP